MVALRERPAAYEVSGDYRNGVWENSPPVLEHPLFVAGGEGAGGAVEPANVVYLRVGGLALRLADGRAGYAAAGGNETRSRKDPISEAELSWIWEGQRFPAAALATPDGRSVEVLNPGRRPGGAGPDFRDAVLRIGGVERRGDVELHLRASGFRAHGHDRDPAYNGVVLHVVYLADEEGDTRLAGGGLAPVAAFAPWVDRRTGELERWLTAPALWSEPCREAESRLGDAGVRALLAAAGARRFEARVTALRLQMEAVGGEETLWRALLGSMGYGGERAAFEALATSVSWAIVREQCGGDGGVLAALLLGAAGLATLPSWATELVEAPREALMRPTGRPANHPARRLRALAALYGRAGGDFVAYVGASVTASKNAKELVARWSVAGDDGERGGSLLGLGRAAEVVVNVVLPFAGLMPALAPRARELAVSLPAQAAYGKTAFLERCLVRGDGRRRVGSAFEQQGLLSFLEEWCSQGGCGRCPFSS